MPAGRRRLKAAAGAGCDNHVLLTGAPMHTALRARVLVFTALVWSALLVGTAPAQNCAGTTTSAVPLVDLGTGTWRGAQGGLYPNGTNVPPAGHAASLAAAAAAIAPLDAQGQPAADGRIVLVSLGMSNTTQEFSTFKAQSDADPLRNPRVVVVDGAQGGQDARRVADPTAPFWGVVDQRLAAAGVTPLQVQAAWLKEAVAGPRDPFPAHAEELRDLLGAIVRIARQRYPNLRLCFLSSRIYAGYATTTLNPEPFAYESGFAVKWLVEQQIQGAASLNADPTAGAVVAPWLTWGPYLWADGLVPRSDGLTWLCSDFAADGTHPGPTARQKVAGALASHFANDPRASVWYLGGDPQRAAVILYGAGCAGSAGVPRLRTNSLPSVGNASFRLGIAGARSGATAVLFVALGGTRLPLGGACQLLVEPGLLLGPRVGTTNASGSFVVDLPVPSDPGLVGARLYTQGFVDDAAGAPFPGLLGISLTEGAELRLGNP
jgi:hypothetical protein